MDPVVAEVDIHLSQELVHQLFLMQYPLRPANKPYVQQDDVVQARIKPAQHQVELKLELDTGGRHFDRERARDLAQQANVNPLAGGARADGKASVRDGVAQDAAKGPMFPSGRMDTFSLRSTNHPMKTHYAAGLLKEGKLCLAPLDGVMQLRPTFDHIDEATRKKNEAEAAENEPAKEDEVAPVQVVFKRRETERAVAARQRSYAHLRQQREDEQWLDLDYVHSESRAAQDLRRKLTECKDNGRIHFNLSAKQYLDVLHTAREPDAASAGAGDAQGAKSTANRTLAQHEIQKLPQAEKIRTILRQAHVLDTASLERLCGGAGSYSLGEIMEMLPSLALFVGGCWVLRSEVLYPGQEDQALLVQATVTVTQAQLRLARDFVITRCAAGAVLRRQEVMDAARLSADMSRDILKQLCRLEPGVGWLFKGEGGAAASHSEALRGQVEEQLRSFCARVEADVQRLQALHSGGNEVPLVRGAQPAGAGATRTDDVARLLRITLEKYGICNRAFLRSRITAVYPGSEVTEAVLETILTRVARELKPVSAGPADRDARVFVIPSVGGVDTDRFRDVVIALFETHPQGRVKRSEIMQACEEAGLQTMSPSVYQRLTKELATSQSGHWALRDGSNGSV